MPRTETILKVFVASPKDVDEERALLEDVVRELNLIWSKQLGVRLDLIKWETHAFPGIGEDAQAVINEQVDDYDIFIGIMWKRAGSPTGRAKSGTIEEFQRAYERYIQNPQSVRIMFYFNHTPAPPSEIDPIQLVSILEFKKALGEKGALYWEYTSRDEFSSLLRLHLSKQVQEWQQTWGINSINAITLPGKDINEVEFSDEEPEEGLLDLIELGNEKFETMNNAILRMTTAVEELGGKMNERTTEMNRIQKIGGQPNMTLLKRIITRSSEDMMQFVARMEPEIPIFKDSYSCGIEAMIKAASISIDFPLNEDVEIEDSLKTVRDLKNTIAGSLDDTSSFRETIFLLPRISTDFNKSKKETLRVLDSLIGEMTSAINLISELEKEFLRLRRSNLLEQV